MTDVLRDEYFVYFAQMKTILTKLKKFRSDGLYPIVDELSDEESAEIRLASYEEASKRDKRFAFLKRPKLINEAGGMFRVQIYGPKIRQTLTQEDNKVKETIFVKDEPKDFKPVKLTDGYIVVSYTEINGVAGMIKNHAVEISAIKATLAQARSYASNFPNALSHICSIHSVVDTRVDQRLEKLALIVEECNALASLIAHSGKTSGIDIDHIDSVHNLIKNLKLHMTGT